MRRIFLWVIVKFTGREAEYLCVGGFCAKMSAGGIVMRKVWVILLALMLLTASAYAEESLTERAVALVRTCDALAGDESYGKAMSASGGKIGELLSTWASGDHEQPRLILHADTASLADTVNALCGNDDTLVLSETAMAELRKKYPASLPSMLNATAGAETLAAAAIITTDVIFADDTQGSGMFILLYDHAVPAAVTWYAENGAVCMQACFLAMDALVECQTAEDVNALLEEQGVALTFASVES